MADRPRIDSRSRRLLAYLAHNRNQMIVDAAVLLTWIVVSAAAFRWLTFPQWARYLVLFVGIAVHLAVPSGSVYARMWWRLPR